MSKLVVSANSLKQLNLLLEKDIDGVILYIDKLSVNSSFYIDVCELDKINFNEKEVIISLNKNMHNSDLELLKSVMLKLKNMNVRILFYDMVVYSIAKELDMVNKLIIYQDHLNTCILSNNFYNSMGIKGTYISSDITGEELLDIKKNTKMEMFFTGYGYVPIFYSRRYLITNYLKYIDEVNDGDKYSIISDNNEEYPIDEEEYGTTIYTKEIVNLINYLDLLQDIDYIVMHSNRIDDDEFNLMVDKFIKKDLLKDCYCGFFNTKTIYKVKGE